MYRKSDLGRRQTGMALPVRNNNRFGALRTAARRVATIARGSVLALLLLSAGLPALEAGAQELTPAVMVAACASCHGPDLQSSGAIPSLDPLDGAVIAASLHGFKSGEIQGTVMNRIAKGYTDAEIDALVQYFVAQH